MLAFLATPLIFVLMPGDTAPTPAVKSKFSVKLPPVAPLPRSQGIPIPVTSARNIFILDRDSKVVLYQKNADMRVYPASTTKMMTALIALEN